MRLDAIARFEGSSLELTYDNPIGLVTVDEDCLALRLELVKALCAEQSVNVLLCKSAGGSQVNRSCYMTTSTKDIFNKIDDACRYYIATGMWVPILVIFDDLSLSILEDAKVVNDLKLFIDKCHKFSVHALFIFSADNDAIWDFQALFVTKGQRINKHRGFIEHGTNHLVEIREHEIIFRTEQAGLLFKNFDEFRQVNIWIDENRRYGRRRRIGPREAQMYGHDKTQWQKEIVKDKEDTIFIIDEPLTNVHFWESTRLEDMLYSLKAHGARFVVIADINSVPMQVRMQLSDWQTRTLEPVKD